MNNIRKIIEERLENAELDFGKTTREFNAELKGQIEAYQDCLNLIDGYIERLEVLEKENKEYFEIVCKQAYLLNNKHIDKPIIEMYMQENEKLKMAIEILKEHIHICRNSGFYKIVLNGETELSLLDYELLKEVLNYD